MHIQFNNRIYIISILKKVFGKHLNIFQLSVDNADNFIKVLSLHWARAVHANLVFVIYFFVVFWFVSLQAGYDITVTHLFRFYIPLLSIQTIFFLNVGTFAFYKLFLCFRKYYLVYTWHNYFFLIFQLRLHIYM